MVNQQTGEVSFLHFGDGKLEAQVDPHVFCLADLVILKACVCYFLPSFYFSPNYSPSKTMNKNVSLSAIALEVDPRKIFKFMMSSIV